MGQFQYLCTPRTLSIRGCIHKAIWWQKAGALQKLKIVDDVVHYNPTICKVLFRVFDYLHLCGQNDITLNPKKFKFCQKEIDFAGYNIAWDGYHTTDNMLSSLSSEISQTNPLLLILENGIRNGFLILEN